MADAQAAPSGRDLQRQPAPAPAPGGISDELRSQLQLVSVGELLKYVRAQHEQVCNEKESLQRQLLELRSEEALQRRLVELRSDDLKPSEPVPSTRAATDFIDEKGGARENSTTSKPRANKKKAALVAASATARAKVLAASSTAPPASSAERTAIRRQFPMKSSPPTTPRSRQPAGKSGISPSRQPAGESGIAVAVSGTVTPIESIAGGLLQAQEAPDGTAQIPDDRAKALSNNAQAHISDMVNIALAKNPARKWRAKVQNAKACAWSIWPLSIELRDACATEEHVESITIAETMISSLTPERTGFNRSFRLMRPMASSLKLETASPLSRCQALLPVFHPNSTFMVGNNILSCFMVLFDALVSPYALAWDISTNSGVLGVTCWFVGMYWLFDFAVSFRTGFYRHGELQLDKRTIAIHYLRTWFFLDVSLLSADWLLIGMSAIGAVDQGSLLFRVGRMARLCKILRITRLKKVLEKVMDSNLSASGRLLMMLCIIVCGFFLFSHLLACMWFILGKYGTNDTGTRWTSNVALGDLQPEDSKFYLYMTSLHWVVAQLTLGATEIQSGSSLERAFTVTLLIFGLIFGSALVSLVSATIIEFVLLQQDKIVKISSLREFLRQYHVKNHLAIDVQLQAQERVGRTLPLRAEDVPAIKCLSASLRLELLCHIRMPHVLKHRLFHLWSLLDTWGLQKLASEAAGMEFLARGDDLFLAGADAKQAYVFISGQLLYTQEPATSKVQATVTKQVQPDTWLCEAALWSKWTHVGKASVQTIGQLLAINAQELVKVIHKFRVLEQIAHAYAHAYHQRLISGSDLLGMLPSDLPLPFTDITDLLPPDVGSGMLRVTTASHCLELSGEQLRLMDCELSNGRCNLLVDTLPSNKVVRTTSTLTLRIYDEYGNVLTQVGNYAQGKGASLACHLPEIERLGTEAPEAAVSRLIATDLEPLADILRFTEAKRSTEHVDTPTYGVPTLLVRTSLVASVCCQSLDVPSMSTHMNLHVHSHSIWDFKDHARRSTCSQDKVFIIGSAGKVKLFMFLEPDAIDSLRCLSTQRRLQSCLSTLDMDANFKTICNQASISRPRAHRNQKE